MSDQLAIDFSKRPSRGRVSYYNTTSLAGDALATARREARKQDVLVLSIMRGAARPMSPSEVWKAGCEAGSDWLLTSVRRSIHTLTAEYRLRKTDEYREGPYGRPERLWIVVGEATRDVPAPTHPPVADCPQPETPIRQPGNREPV